MYMVETLFSQVVRMDGFKINKNNVKTKGLNGRRKDWHLARRISMAIQ